MNIKSRSNKFIIVSFLVSTFFVVSGCGKSRAVPASSHISNVSKQSLAGKESNQSKIENQIGVPEPERYVRTIKNSTFGHLELFTINQDYYAKRQTELASSTLQALTLSADYNTDVYALENYEIPGAVIARPKVFIKSSVMGKRVLLQDNKDGQAKVEVSVALVDGLVSELFTGKGTRPLPEELLVKNKDALISEIEKLLKQKPTFISNVPCPSNLKLFVEGNGEYTVDFKSKLKSCPINTFFPAEITLKAQEWQGVLLAFAEGRKVEIEATLNLSIPITVNYGKFLVSKKTVREEIKEALKEVKDPISVEQMEVTEKTLISAFEKAFETSFPQELYLPVLDEIIQENFTIGSKDHCPKGNPCFSWKEEPSLLERPDYVFELRRDEYVGKPLVFTSRSQVTDYLSDHQEFMLNAAPENPLELPKTSEVNQLFRTVQDGDIAEFQVRHLNIGELTIDEPKTEHFSNKICIAPYSQCTNGLWACTNPNIENYNCRNVCSGGYEKKCKVWSQNTIKQNNVMLTFAKILDAVSFINSSFAFEGNNFDRPDRPPRCLQREDVCRSWSQVCDQRQVCDRLTPPAIPTLPYRTDTINPSAQDFLWMCSNYAYNQCDADKWADHWQRVVTWANPTMTPRMREVTWDSKYWEKTIAGLSIKFSWATATDPQELTCPLSALEHRMIGQDKILITLHNTPTYQPFNEQNLKAGYGPSISLTNQIVFPSEFQCGSMTENWEGKRRYICRMGEKPEITQETTVTEDEQKLKRGEKLGIYQPYYPRVELQGRLRIIGSYFESGVESL